MAHYHQDCIMSVRQGQPLNEVHQDGIPRSFTNWEEVMGVIGLVMERLAVMTDHTGVDVVGDKGDDSGPIELTVDVLDHFGNAWVASQAVAMVGEKDVQLDVLIIMDIEETIIKKE